MLRDDSYIGAHYKGYFVVIRGPYRGVAMATIGVSEAILLPAIGIHDP